MARHRRVSALVVVLGSIVLACLLATGLTSDSGERGASEPAVPSGDDDVSDVSTADAAPQPAPQPAGQPEQLKEVSSATTEQDSEDSSPELDVGRETAGGTQPHPSELASVGDDTAVGEAPPPAQQRATEPPHEEDDDAPRGSLEGQLDDKRASEGDVAVQEAGPPFVEGGVADTASSDTAAGSTDASAHGQTVPDALSATDSAADSNVPDADHSITDEAAQLGDDGLASDSSVDAEAATASTDSAVPRQDAPEAVRAIPHELYTSLVLPPPAEASALLVGDASVTDDELAALEQRALMCHYRDTSARRVARARALARAAAAAAEESGMAPDGEGRAEAASDEGATEREVAQTEDCGALRFRVARIRAYRASIASRTVEAEREVLAGTSANDDAPGGSAPRRLAALPTVPMSSVAGNGYLSFFNEYALPSRPVVLVGAAFDSEGEAWAAEVAAGWADAARIHSDTPRAAVPWSECCSALAPRVALPPPLWNDYLRRLTRVGETKQHRKHHSHDRATAVELAAAWPRVFVMHRGDTMPVHVPAFGLHTMLVVLEGSLEVATYPSSQVPLLGASLDGTFNISQPFEVPDGCMATGFTGIADAGSSVFIPSGSAVAWGAAMSSGSAHRATVLQVAFADASNLNAVRQSLMIGALVDERQAQLLRLVQDQGLDITMARIPQPLSVSAFAKWPRDPPATPDMRSSQTSSATAGGAAESGAGRKKISAAQRRRMLRNKKRQGRAGRLKAWQDTKRWDWKMRLLTMPAPTQPRVVDASRTQVTLSFLCPLHGDGGHKHDGSAHDNEKHPVVGYTVVWSAVCLTDTPATAEHGDGVGQLAAVRAAALGAGAAMDERAAIRSSGVGHEQAELLARSLAGFDVFGTATFRFDDKPSAIVVGCGDAIMDRLCVPIRGLVPGHSYTFKVAALTDDGASTFSGQSAPVTTAEKQRPTRVSGVAVEVVSPTTVRLSWTPPEDDGGSPILGHVVSRTQTLPATPGDMVVVGSTSPVLVSSLVPGGSYRFKVLAVNELGPGPYSRLTATAVMPLTGSTSGRLLQVQGFDPNVLHDDEAANSEDGQAGSSATESPEEAAEEARITRALHVALQHRAAVGLAPRELSDDSREVVGRPGAGGEQPRAPRPQLGRQVRGIAFFGGTAPHVGGDVEGGEGSTSTLGGMGVPCFGPQATISDSAETLEIMSSKFEGWASYFSPRAYNVRAEIVAASPLNGAASVLANSELVKDRIVYFDRGGTSLRDKVVSAARAGALGVVIGDVGGRCDNGFGQLCVRGSDQAFEGFASTDEARMWRDGRIPALLVNSAAAASLRRTLGVAA